MSRPAAEQARRREAFVRVSEAFKMLSNPTMRREYDVQSVYGSYGGSAADAAAAAAAGARTWTADDFNAYNKAHGFYSGTFSGESPYKIFSNGTMIGIVCLAMFASTMWHLFRHGEAKKMLSDHAEKKSREAAKMLSDVKTRAMRLTPEEQLQQLHERRAGKRPD